MKEDISKQTESDKKPEKSKGGESVIARIGRWLIGRKEEAIVLTRRRNGYQILLKEYMLECDLSTSSGVALKPEDLIQVTLQQVSARRDTLSAFMG